MADINLPDHTFTPSDLILARDALLIVHEMVSKAVGDATGDDAEERLYELASGLRDIEKTEKELPGVAVGWPIDGPVEGTGEMSFHVAAGGTEYDGVTVRWKTGVDLRPTFTYDYDGRDELYEHEADEREA